MSGARPPLRIGVLGAARIAPMALVRPARSVPAVHIDAVAARDPARARAFAQKHGIPRVHESYDALLSDPELDAVYNPLPNSLHAAWTIRALEAGKHVLCEKPIAATAAEAETMAAAAGRAGRVLMEAFHYRYHPLFARLLAIVDAGEIGELRHVESHFCIPMLSPRDIRYRRDLAGGALMDVGCYTISMLRHLVRREPEVIRARARWTRGGVDRFMEAHLRFPGGPTARFTCALLSSWPVRITLRAEGSAGAFSVLNPIAPQLFHRLRVTTSAGARTERVRGPGSYTAQLSAFLAAVRDGAKPPTDAADGVRNMRTIDAVYAAAGRPG